MPHPHLLISQYRQRLEMALIQHLGARGETLSAKVDRVAALVPPELGGLLDELATPPEDGGPDMDAAVIDYAFRCGRAIERIEALARLRAAEDLIYTDEAGNPLMDPAHADLDRLSSFRIARDRWLRKAADFSLKLLAATVLLLILGFAIGVI